MDLRTPVVDEHNKYHRDPRHAEWVRGFMAVLDEMKRYVMEYHTTGLVWNPKVNSVE